MYRERVICRVLCARVFWVELSLKFLGDGPFHPERAHQHSAHCQDTSLLRPGDRYGDPGPQRIGYSLRLIIHSTFIIGRDGTLR